MDLAYKDTGGYWRMKMVAAGYGSFATIPGAGTTQLSNSSRTLVNTAQPWIEWTHVYRAIDASSTVPTGTQAANELSAQAPLVNGHYQLLVGVRYTVAVRLNPGAVHNNVRVLVNPDLRVPASVKLINSWGPTDDWVTADETRVFAVTCTEPGSFPIGFMLRDAGTGNMINPDYGIRIACTAQQTGLYGTITTRNREARGRYVAGSPVSGATVKVEGFAPVTTIADGSWSVPTITGGPYTVTVTAAGMTSTVAINVMVPAGSGTKFDAALESAFTNLGAGVKYTQYVDYSRGRTLFHVVEVPAASVNVKLVETDRVGLDWVTLLGNAQAHNIGAVMNGGYFWVDGSGKCDADPVPPNSDYAVGYFHGRRTNGTVGYINSVRLACTGNLATLTVKGASPSQQIDIVDTDANFKADTATWSPFGNPPTQWFYDPNGDNQSDVNYAIQMVPRILRNGMNEGPVGDAMWARTTVGKDLMGTRFWLVVSDGEGVNGGNGAEWVQFGGLYQQLGAWQAMGLDGGLSTELVLRTNAGTWRNVNTITGEQHSWDPDPSVEGETIESANNAPGGTNGAVGSVFNYVSVGW